MDEVCKKIHERVDEKLEDHDKLLSKHTDDINILKSDIKDINSDNRETRVVIKDLCEDLTDLTKTFRWFIALLLASLISFVFFVMQSKV